MKDRKGFTLVELLVVITILLALAAMVISAFRPSAGEKMRTAGRLGQSAILGARDRALHAKANRGLRLIVDPNNPGMATGFVYLQPIEPQEYAGVVLTADKLHLRALNSDWLALQSAGFVAVPNPVAAGLAVPYRIQVPAGGPWYTSMLPIVDLGGGIAEITLTTSVIADAGPQQIKLQPVAEQLPNHQPIYLPSGIVIDIGPNRSSTAAQADLMFSPRGGVAGPLAAGGPIYLLLRSVEDVVAGVDPRDVTAPQRDSLVLTIFPQTGHVQTFPVNTTDGNADGQADDIFAFAKVGSAAQ